MDTTVIIFLILLGIYLGSYLYIRFYEKILFIYDPKNKYRRMCRLCGQIQEEFGEYLDFNKKGHWDSIGRLIDPKCPCHYYSKRGYNE